MNEAVRAIAYLLNSMPLWLGGWLVGHVFFPGYGGPAELGSEELGAFAGLAMGIALTDWMIGDDDD